MEYPATPMPPNRPSRRARKVVPIVAAALLVLVGLPVAAWEAWWPTNVDRRALNGFGVPVPGAIRKGPDYVSEGNALCLDVCTRLARPFTLPADLRLGEVLHDLALAARRAGYTTVYAPSCSVRSPARSEFECGVSAHSTHKNVVILVFGTDPVMITPNSIAGMGLNRLPDDTAVRELTVGIAEE